MQHLLGLCEINKVETPFANLNNEGVEDGVRHSLVHGDEHLSVTLDPVEGGSKDVIDLEVDRVVDALIEIVTKWANNGLAVVMQGMLLTMLTGQCPQVVEVGAGNCLQMGWKVILSSCNMQMALWPTV